MYKPLQVVFHPLVVFVYCSVEFGYDTDYVLTPNKPVSSGVI